MLFPVSRTKFLAVPWLRRPGRLFIHYIMYMYQFPGITAVTIHMHVCFSLCRGSLLVEALNVSSWELCLLRRIELLPPGNRLELSTRPGLCGTSGAGREIYREVMVALSAATGPSHGVGKNMFHSIGKKFYPEVHCFFLVVEF